MTIGRADEIVDELSGILELTREQSNLGPVAASKLDAAIDTADVLAGQLVEVQGLIVLAEVRQDDLDMDDARRFWNSLDSERRLSSLDGLVSLSPTLSALHKAAMTFESAYRFSDGRLRLAAEIAEITAGCPQYVGLLHNTRSDASPTFSIKSEAVGAVERLLRTLERSRAATGFVIKGQIKPKEGKPFWVPINKLKGRGGVRSWLVQRGTVAPEFVDFLDGDWLTAYAYGIAQDQFSRDGKPFEIYSKVQYRLPADLGGGRSDFDVLVRTADLLFCIECKSGKVLSSHHGKESAAAKTLASAERVDDLLDTMGVGLDRVYQLLYLRPPGEEPSLVRQSVRDGRVPLLVTTPSDERRIIQQAALGSLNFEGGADTQHSPVGSWLKVTSSNAILRITLREDGTLTERAEFDDSGEAWSGTWSATGTTVEIRIQDWVAELKFEAPSTISGKERNSAGRENTVLLTRFE